MAKIKLEYIWLDGYYPTQNMRSKTKVEEHENFQGTLEELGNWSFDGSLKMKTTISGLVLSKNTLSWIPKHNCL